VTTQARERDYDERDDELSAIARSLHREWDSPRLWSSIAAGILAHELAIEAGLERRSRAPFWNGRWQALAAAAVIAITLAPTSWLGWRWFMLGPRPDPATAEQRRQALLT